MAGLPTPELYTSGTGQASVHIRIALAGRKVDMTQPVQTIDVLLAEHMKPNALAIRAARQSGRRRTRVGRRFAVAPIVATHRKLTRPRATTSGRARAGGFRTGRSPPRLPWRLRWAGWMLTH